MKFLCLPTISYLTKLTPTASYRRSSSCAVFSLSYRREERKKRKTGVCRWPAPNTMHLYGCHTLMVNATHKTKPKANQPATSGALKRLEGFYLEGIAVYFGEGLFLSASTGWNSRCTAFTHTHTHTEIHTEIHTHIYIYIYMQSRPISEVVWDLSGILMDTI
ncbi:hypothetical protein BGX38DRAFT_574226 [Terfezia claveryi]|nr:hypothetical protein BGX38DRAFT_574226 [Terfezia claveryi]